MCSGRGRAPPPLLWPSLKTQTFPLSLLTSSPLPTFWPFLATRLAQAGSFNSQASTFPASCLLSKPYMPFRSCPSHGREGKSSSSGIPADVALGKTFNFSEPQFLLP